MTAKGHVKITDFGLARWKGATTLTKSGTRMGTAYYMSPEQAEGRRVDHRSDLFSLGVVLYELLCNQRPFEGDTEPAVIYELLSKLPDPLARYCRDAPAELERVVLKCLAKPPEERYQSAADLVADLKALRHSIGSDRKPPEEPLLKTRRSTLVSGTAIVAILLLLLISKPWKLVISPSDETMASMRRLAVLYLQNHGSPEDEYLCYGITEDLIVDLTRNGVISVIPMRAVALHKDSDASIEDIAKELRADFVVDGSMFKQDSIITVSVQLVDMRVGGNLWADRWNERLAGLPHIKELLAKGITHALLIDSSRAARAEIGDPDAENPVAYDYYLRGKYAFEKKTEASDVAVALGLFRKALELEPSLVAARIAVARLLSYQGYPKEAITELTRALSEARRRNIRAQEATILLLLARNDQTRERSEKVIQYAKEAVQISEDQGDLNGELDALVVLVETHQLQSHLKLAEPYLSRILVISQELDLPSAWSAAFLAMGKQHFLRHSLDSVEYYYNKAFAIVEETGNLQGIGTMHRQYARLCDRRGDGENAMEHSRKALAIHRELGSPRAVAYDLHTMGGHYLRAGDYPSYLEVANEAAAIFSDLGDYEGYAACMNQIAASHMNMGQYDQAITILQDLIRDAAALDDESWRAILQQQLGFAYYYRGDLDSAKSHLYKSLLIKESMREDERPRAAIAFTCASLSELYFLQHEIDSCHKYSERALAVAAELNDLQVRLWSAAYLNAAKAKSGHFEGGIVQLRLILHETDSLGLGENQIVAMRLLGQVLVEDGRSDAERQEGRAFLEDALGFADEKKIAHEKRWLSELLRQSLL